MNLPKWQCFDVVGASRIEKIEFVERAPLSTEVVILTEHHTFRMSREWASNHLPKVGGFIVVNKHGVISHSEAGDFLHSYMQLEVVQQGAPKNFEDAIRHAINKYSKESGSDTPDFILAKYMTGCLEAFNAATKARGAWYAPTQQVSDPFEPQFPYRENGPMIDYTKAGPDV